MAMEWTKAYMPRSLYGRAALILLLPVVLLQLVVSVVFIQRHYEGVAVQMTRNVALELRYLVGRINAAPDAAQALAAVEDVAGALAFALELPAEPPEADRLRVYDLSGRAIVRTMRAELDAVRAVDVTYDRQVRAWLDTRHGVMSAMFDRRRVAASNPHQLLVLMVVVSILLTVIAFVFLRNQLRPIKRLARASEAFGKGQVVSYRPSGAIEVRAAGQAFLDMRGRIERQIEQRTMMLSGISHDLRTPLTRLKLGLSMLEESPEVRAMLGDVSDMERLVDEFLAFARDDALDDPEAVDPVPLVAEVVERFRAAGDSVRLEAEPGQGTALLRPMAVARAVENLVGNAVHHGRNCLVSVRVDDRAVRIAVEDDGPGIPAEARGEALKPFVRLDAARSQNRGGGVGLGLAIAHDIARRHGGRLELGESAALGGLRAVLVLAR